MNKRPLILHPFLMAAYTVLFLFSNNIGQFYLFVIVKPMLFILGSTLVVWCFFGIVLKNYRKAGLIVSVFLLLFFSYGHVKSFFLGDKISTLAMLFGWIALFTLCIIPLVKIKKSFKKETQIFNVITGTLFVISVIKIITGQINTVDWQPRLNTRIDTKAKFEQKKIEYYPDIYFIVLDAYARDDVLKEMYGFDNADFLVYLRNKGFYVAERSAANYSQTGLSIGSCFNLSYLDKLVKKYIGQNNSNRAFLREIIEKSVVLSYLRKHGYSIISFQTGIYETEIKNADFYFQSKFLPNPFLNALINITPIPDVNLRNKDRDVFSKHRDHILSIFEKLRNLARLGRMPKFVFAHINLPHPPFIFGSNGEFVMLEKKYDNFDGNWLINPGRLTRAEYRKGYRDQVVFVNKKITKTIDDILSNSRQPPIILILGDHGPRSETVWHDPEMTNMKECLTNLSAYYLPRGGHKNLYPEITPVNIFAVIFNYYFGEKLDLLPDKSYFSTAKHLYKFYDVTKQIQIVTEKG